MRIFTVSLAVLIALGAAGGPAPWTEAGGLSGHRPAHWNGLDRIQAADAPPHWDPHFGPISSRPDFARAGPTHPAYSPGPAVIDPFPRHVWVPAHWRWAGWGWLWVPGHWAPR